MAAAAHLAYLCAGLFLGYLGPNPVEVITHQTGQWGLHFLLLSLLITPLRKLCHWSAAIRLRRFLGLWSFAYTTLHLFVFLLFDHFFNGASILADIIKRPYISVGFAAFVLMLLLAVTSFKFMVRCLAKRWVILHRSVYLLAILAVVHYWWLVKADKLWPFIYALVLALLLGVRVYWYYQKKTTVLRG